MRTVTLVSVALIGLCCAAAPAGAAPPPGAPAQPQPQPQTSTPAPAQPNAVAQRPQNPGQRAAELRRRSSYAACNRESHRRKLSGGARRRFLVRCRLGYERRASPNAAPARKP